MIWMLVVGLVVVGLVGVVLAVLVGGNKDQYNRNPTDRQSSDADATGRGTLARHDFNREPAARPAPRPPISAESSGGGPWSAESRDARASHGDRRITEAGVGDTISIPGGGERGSALTVLIDIKSRYESEGAEWVELSGHYQGRRVYIEVSQEDGLEVCVDLGDPPLTLDDVGLTEDDLIRMDEAQDTSESFFFQQIRWQFDSSREVFCHEGGEAGREGLYVWEFDEQGGDGNLCVEKREGEPFEVRLARYVEPDGISVS